MAIDYSEILNSPRYAAEKKIINTSGKKKTKIIYFFLLLPPVLVAFIIYAIFKLPAGIRQEKERREAIGRFARSNGFTYEATNKISPLSPDSPDRLILPYNAEVQAIMSKMTGVIDNLPFEYMVVMIQLKTYKGISTQSGAENRTLNIFKIQLPINMPRLFADSKFNNITGFELNANNFENLEEHSLEGDFPQYYSVKAEHTDRIDALSVLSPEVMEALKHNFNYDLWIHDKELQLLVNGTEIEYFAAIPLVFKNAEILVNEIDRISRANS